MTTTVQIVDNAGVSVVEVTGGGPQGVPGVPGPAGASIVGPQGPQGVPGTQGPAAVAADLINDAAGAGTVDKAWSADKTTAAIAAAKLDVKNELVSGAAAALDTLQELAAAVNNDPSFAATVADALGNRVRFDAAQTLTAVQLEQVWLNIDLGDPATDFAAVYAAAKV